MIHKIEGFDYRKDILLQEKIIEYFDDSELDSIYLKSLPKTITINDFRSKEVSVINLSDYKINPNFDLQIFTPVDIK